MKLHFPEKISNAPFNFRTSAKDWIPTWPLGGRRASRWIRWRYANLFIHYVKTLQINANSWLNWRVNLLILRTSRMATNKTSRRCRPLESSHRPFTSPSLVLACWGSLQSTRWATCGEMIHSTCNLQQRIVRGNIVGGKIRLRLVTNDFQN